MARLSDCTSEQVGYIIISYSICFPIQFFFFFLGGGGGGGVELDPKLAFEQYQKDMWCYETYVHSYTVYIKTQMDKMIDQFNHFQSHDTNFTTNVVRKRGSDPDRRPHLNNIFTPSPEQLSYIDTVTHDFNDQGKTRGFLASLDFTFIGPDRQTFSISDLKSYIDMARTIGATWLPNYQMARFPVHSILTLTPGLIT